MIKRLAAAITAIALIITNVPAALAAAPANDNIASATSLTTFPFTDRVDTAEATVEADEPTVCSSTGTTGGTTGTTNTVWYRFDSGTESYNLTVDAIGSDYPAQVGIYVGSPGSFNWLGCLSPGGSTTVTTSPGETWWFQATGNAPSSTTGTTTGGTTTTTGTTGETTTTTGTTGTTGGTTGTTGTTGDTTGSTGTTSTTTGTTGGVTAAAVGSNLVFNANAILVVPIVVTLSVNPSGSVNRSGDTVMLSGNVSCSRSGPLSVSVTVTQIFAGRFVATGSGSSDQVNCGPDPQTWSAMVFGGPPVLFGPGKASADASTGLCDEQGCGSVGVTETVHLKRGQ